MTQSLLAASWSIDGLRGRYCTSPSSPEALGHYTSRNAVWVYMFISLSMCVIQVCLSTLASNVHYPYASLNHSLSLSLSHTHTHSFSRHMPTSSLIYSTWRHCRGHSRARTGSHKHTLFFSHTHTHTLICLLHSPLPISWMWVSE